MKPPKVGFPQGSERSTCQHAHSGSQSLDRRFTMDTRYAATVFLLILSASYARSQEPSGKCVTPNSLMGECREISTCEYVVSMIKNRLSAETINSIRKYQCGFKGSQPLVCCPDEVPRDPPSTERPNLRLLPRKTCGLWWSRAIVSPKAFLFEYPWMALIRYKDEKGVKNRCGGVIINERYILTAAHCITKLPKGLELESVRLGEHTLNSDPDCEDEETFKTCAPPAEDYEIEEVIPHPKFDNKNIQHDIGLIRLSRTINFARESTQPICLPLESLESSESRSPIMAGWGVTMEGESSPDLIWNRAKPVDAGVCADMYKSFTNIYNSTQTCIESEYGPRGVCVGDSGGPLMEIKEGKAVVRGVMSFAARLCRSDSLPRVYSLVEPYVDWILSSMKD